MSERWFDGTVAWVTGGGGGIGAACSRELARRGASVAVLDVDDATAESTAAGCRASGARAVAVIADASDPDRIADAHARIVDELGPVDVLVNNVAVALSSDLDVSDEDHWDKVHGLNFRSFVRTTRLVTPSMKARRAGSAIVNINSNHCRRGFPGWSAYASAKGAVASLTRQQAVELAPWGIRVVSVTPGPTETPMNLRRFAEADDPDAMRASFCAGVPLGRLGVPEDVANVVAFAASPLAAFVTGADLRVDGGESIHG